MARTALTAQRISSAGTELTMTAANVDGHSIPLRAGMILLVRNGDASPHTVTIPTPLTVDSLAVSEQVITVTNGEDRYIALGTKDAYRQADGTAYVNFDAVTSMTCALLQV